MRGGEVALTLVQPAPVRGDFAFAPSPPTARHGIPSKYPSSAHDIDQPSLAAAASVIVDAS
jgi:hypothetical protein